MICDVIKLNDYQAITLPSEILETLDNPKSFEVNIIDNKIVLLPQQKVRNGWDKAFKEMAQNKDDKLLIDDNIDLDLDNV